MCFHRPGRAISRVAADDFFIVRIPPVVAAFTTEADIDNIYTALAAAPPEVAVLGRARVAWVTAINFPDASTKAPFASDLLLARLHNPCHVPWPIRPVFFVLGHPVRNDAIGVEALCSFCVAFQKVPCIVCCSFCHTRPAVRVQPQTIIDDARCIGSAISKKLAAIHAQALLNYVGGHAVLFGTIDFNLINLLVD